LTWVFSTEDLAPIEAAIGRPAIEGHRRRPDGTDLKWKQVGVKELLTDPELPFFIQWEDGHHPSEVGAATASIQSLIFANEQPLHRSAFKNLLTDALSQNNIELRVETNPEETVGLLAINFSLGQNELKIY